MKKVKLLFKDSNHASNQDIIAFLDNNLDKINQANITVDFRIVADSEIPALRQRGVTKLPILVVGGKKIYERSSEIKDALKQLCMQGGKVGEAGPNKKFESGDPDEQLREFMESDLNMDAWENDKDDEGAEDHNFTDKMGKMVDQRNKHGMGGGPSKNTRPKKRSEGKSPDSSSSGSSSSAVERIQRKGGGGSTSRDDQLMMEKFSETGIAMDM
jgi:hypothetical protein